MMQMIAVEPVRILASLGLRVQGLQGAYTV